MLLQSTWEAFELCEEYRHAILKMLENIQGQLMMSKYRDLIPEMELPAVMLEYEYFTIN